MALMKKKYSDTCQWERRKYHTRCAHCRGPRGVGQLFGVLDPERASGATVE